MTRKKTPKTRPKTSKTEPLLEVLRRIALALEADRPPPKTPVNEGTCSAFVWVPEPGALKAVEKVNRLPLSLLQGIDRQARSLMDNTLHHAKRLPANNALLWGARGTGKSSLVKAVHAEVNKNLKGKAQLALVEIHREDIPTLPALLSQLRGQSRRYVLLCDDLSFEGQDTSYKALKSVLEGGIEGRPENVILYATSNRRHLMAREMIENERAAAIHDTEPIEEKVSLSDRFGLWLGFHHLDQDTYLAIVSGYVQAFGIPINDHDLRAAAIDWSMTRGARSGRVAWQFVQDLAGELGVRIKS
jgi:uncharacterized protein